MLPTQVALRFYEILERRSRDAPGEGASAYVARRFGANLAEARRLADMSQEELGFRTSMNRTTISQIERRERVPGLDSAVKLAAAFETSLGELTEGIGWKSPEFAVGRFVFAEPGVGAESKSPSQPTQSRQA